MAIRMAQAKALCDKSELALVRASTRPMVGKLSVDELKKSLQRARKIRDKWLDQSRGQHRAVHSKRGYRRSDANRRSAEKAALFAEVVAAIEAQLAALSAAKPAPAEKPKPRAAKSAIALKPARKKSTNPLLATLSPAPALPGIQFNRIRQIESFAAAKQSKFKFGSLKRTQKHGHAMNKRNQARRDARGRR